MVRKIFTSSLIALIGLGGFFVNIEKQETSNNSVGYSIEGISSTYAADPSTPTKEDISKKWNDAIDYLNMGMGVLTAISAPAIILASWLMSPDWTSGDLFGLRGVMHTLWITVSNILYFIYAILLIVIALATMFNQEKFGYKAMLPKLALGIIMVPFTWWFVQWTISLASVVTASVITIPQDTLSKITQSSGDNWIDRPVIPAEFTINEKTDSGAIKTAVDDCSKYANSLNQGPSQAPSTGCISPKAFAESAGGQWSPLVTYGYGIFKFQYVDKIDGTTDVVKAAIQLVHRGIIAVLMFFVFGLLVIALIFILLMRAIKLWMYAIFSPLFTLHFVIGKDVLGEKMNDFSLKEFIGLAFVPAVVGITLSFGLVIVSALMTPVQNGIQGQSNKNTLILFGNNNNKITAVQGTPDTDGKTKTTTKVEIGGITWNFEGPATNSKTGGQIFGALDNAGNSLGVIIIDIIALVFVWASFMAAKGVSKAVDAAVKPFEEIGNKIGGMAKDLPKYAPLPLPGGSIAGMNKTITGISQIPEYTANKNFEESSMGKFIKSHTGGANTAEVMKLRDALTNNAQGLQEAARSMTQSGFKNDGLQELKKLEVPKVMETVKRNNRYTEDQAKNIESLVTKLKKEGLNEYESYKLQGLLAGDLKSTDGDTTAKNTTSKYGPGTTNAGNPTGGTKATDGPNALGNGSVTINGATIIYNGLKDFSKTQEVATQLSNEIKRESVNMTQPTLEDIKKMLKDMMVRGEDQDKIAPEILNKLKGVTFKTKT